jgi:sugar lactone lactonase YvrE
MNICRRVRLALVAGALLTGAYSVPAEITAGARLDRITGDVEAYLVAEGLSSPDGLAIHPQTHELYVSEETAGRVSVIRNGRAEVAVNGNWTISRRIPEWAVNTFTPLEHWLRPELQSPEGIAFSREGDLYVLEDAAGGRLLEFTADAQGQYHTARALPIPWTSEPYAWEGLTVAADGRIFIAGSSVENGSAFSGSVLMRDQGDDWWVVDCGPFAPFSSVALSRDEEILIVAEEGAGGVTWWDTVRQRDIQTVSKALGNVEGVTTLPDGSIIAAQESAPNRHGGYQGRLVRIDPMTGDMTTLAEGFKAIESVLLDPQTGYLYVSEDGTGSIIEVRPAQRILATEYLLKRTLLASESQSGLPPKRWPPFLKGFFNRMGVETRDEDVASYQPTPVKKKKARKDLTLQEVGERVPLVAGKVKMNSVATEEDPDPIQEISFVHFFPNQVIHIDRNVMPGVCLFAARRASGKIERNRPLLGLVADHWSQETGWSRLSDAASLQLPFTTCSATRQDDSGVAITMCFLGMEITSDYYLSMNYGKRNEASLTTDLTDGTTSSCEATFVESDAQGNEVVNLVMTGFMPRRTSGMGWLNIGKHNRWSLVTPERGQWISRWVGRNMPQLAELARKRDSDLLAILHADPRQLNGEHQADATPAVDEPTARKDEKQDPAAQQTTQKPDNEMLPTAQKPQEEPLPTAQHAPANDQQASSAGWGLIRPEDVPLFYESEKREADDSALTNLVFSRVLAAWNEMEF